jgi:hypothetical protein
MRVYIIPTSQEMRWRYGCDDYRTFSVRLIVPVVLPHQNVPLVVHVMGTGAGAGFISNFGRSRDQFKLVLPPNHQYIRQPIQ